MLDQYTYKSIVRGYTTVDQVRGEIEGYVAIWGDPENRDSYGTWFDRETPPEMGLDFKPWPLKYEHSHDGVIRREIIGKIYEVWFDEVGIRFKAKLDRSSRFFDRMAQEVIENMLATSSGTGGYDSEFDDDGRFVTWTLFEVSLTQWPSESRMPKVQMIRSDRPERNANGDLGGDHPNQLEGLTMPEIRNISDIIAQISELEPDGATLEDILGILGSEYSPEEILQFAQQGALADESRSTGETTMPDNTQETTHETPVAAPAPIVQIDYGKLAAAVVEAQAKQAAQTAPAPEATPVAEGDGRSRQKPNQTDQDNARRIAELEKQLAELQGEPPEDDGSETRHKKPKRPEITNVLDLRYAHLDAVDMALAHQMLRSAGQAPSEDFRIHLTHKASDHIHDDKSFRFAPDKYAVRAAFPFRANEIMASDIAGQGDEWVGVFYSTQLWEKVRISTIFERLSAAGMMVREVPQGSESIVIPTEGADPTWYKAQKSKSVNATTERPEVSVHESDTETGNKTLVPGTAKARVLIEDELVEDSLVAIIPHVRSRLEISAQDIIEYLFINSDTVTTTNTNINLIDDTPVSSGIQQPVYLVTNGALKNALTTAGKNRDAGGGLADTDFLNTIALLGKPLRANRRLLLGIVDVSTEMKTIQLASVKTRDVNSAATIESGEITNMWRMPMLVSGQMDLAQAADGKISVTPGNNVTGRILVVVPRYWVAGWKRRVMMESAKDIDSGVWTIVASMRLGFAPFSTDASAVSYNVGV